METVVESLCCREVSAFWSLVEELTPQPADVTCLTQHPGFKACCLNPFVLKNSILTLQAGSWSLSSQHARVCSLFMFTLPIFLH